MAGAWPPPLKWYLQFDPNAYGPEVADILALGGAGARLMPLVAGRCVSQEAARTLSKHTAHALFGRSRAPEAALAGLWVYFSCFEEGHKMAQEIDSPEGSFWHAILHRQEPDAGNSSYWFGKVGAHPIYGDLLQETLQVLKRHPADFQTASRWDPLAFIAFCERARREPGSPFELAALEIQRAEWQLLFDYCARPR